MPKPQARIRPEYMITRQGRQMPLYVGVLDAAHEDGLVRTEVKVLQFPSAENDQTTIVHATAVFLKDGVERVFENIGDANPKNVGANIAPHAIRMAATRALSRALRDGINAAEAVDDADEDAPANRPPQQRQQAQKAEAPPLMKKSDWDRVAGLAKEVFGYDDEQAVAWFKEKLGVEKVGAATVAQAQAVAQELADALKAQAQAQPPQPPTDDEAPPFDDVPPPEVQNTQDRSALRSRINGTLPQLQRAGITKRPPGPTASAADMAQWLTEAENALKG